MILQDSLVPIMDNFNYFRFAYLPFGQGPRGCIGMRFALLEAKIALAKILMRYNLSVSDKTKEPIALDPAQIISAPKHGIYILLDKRG